LNIPFTQTFYLQLALRIEVKKYLGIFTCKAVHFFFIYYLFILKQYESIQVIYLKLNSTGFFAKIGNCYILLNIKHLPITQNHEKP
tara:strand:+ start:58809 stop:59066 length:258 start_codon:yes stop_codon:yes gene_type:complete